nr:dynein regulatory complex subunit 3-like [Leptinotarsa decemlineata]
MAEPCKAREPRVINNALIEKCIDYQYPKGEIGRLMREEGIPKEEIEEIRFEFMNILKIDHLWVLKSLTKLQLNNNFIEKIENLETLVKLEELDLSFNKINKIENLDKLVNLRKLSLFDNLLKKIENMDTLTKLTIFTIGKNKIDDMKNIHYLRKFSKLTSLNMAHNPCAEQKNFRIYVAAFLPQLVYYEYKRIEETEREEGLAMFSKQLQNIEKLEEEENSRIAITEKQRKDAELHSLSFVEYLNSRYLFDLLFDGDIEGEALLEIGDEIKDFHMEYEEQFINLCQQVFEIGQKHYKIRMDEVNLFTTTVDKAKKENQEESVNHMEEFMKKKYDVFDQLNTLTKHFENDVIDIDKYKEKVDEYFVMFNGIIHDTWKKLMKLELQLFEQMEEVNQNFEHVLADMINAFIEEAQAVFAQIREQEVIYTENISDISSRYLTQANMGEITVPDVLKSIMSDKEALNNAIATTHDAHLQIIDNREDTLVERAKHWLETFTKNLTKDEIKRNRDKLLEINHFLDIQREEFDELAGDNYLEIGAEDSEFNF